MSDTYNPYEAPKSDSTEAWLDSGDYELATIGERVLARVIDALILGFTTFVLLILIWVVAFTVGELTGDHVEPLGEFLFSDNDLAYGLLTFNLFNPYVYANIFITHALFLMLHGVTLHRSGQTIGKKLLNIAIVDADTYEKVPVLRLLVLRYLVWEIPFLINVVFCWITRLVDLGYGLKADRRTLHDITANTIVIKA